MEAAIPTEAPPTPAPEPAAEIGVPPTVRKILKYSEFVDVGDGAVECEHARDGQCENLDHFHAWCRLPNALQQEEIRKKGAAAKARVMRLYADRNSDSSIVLDQELGQSSDPVFIGAIIEELLARDWVDDYQEAERDLGETDEFENVVADGEEYRRQKHQADLEPDQRTEEYRALDAHMNRYVEALRARLEEVRKPKREALQARAPEDVIELARERRVQELADAAFAEMFNRWLWFVGTHQVTLHDSSRRPYVLRWSEIGDPLVPVAGSMAAESPEVIEAIGDTYVALQVAFQRGSSGN